MQIPSPASPHPGASARSAPPLPPCRAAAPGPRPAPTPRRGRAGGAHLVGQRARDVAARVLQLHCHQLHRGDAALGASERARGTSSKEDSWRGPRCGRQQTRVAARPTLWRGGARRVGGRGEACPAQQSNLVPSDHAATSGAPSSGAPQTHASRQRACPRPTALRVRARPQAREAGGATSRLGLAAAGRAWLGCWAGASTPVRLPTHILCRAKPPSSCPVRASSPPFLPPHPPSLRPQPLTSDRPCPATHPSPLTPSLRPNPLHPTGPALPPTEALHVAEVLGLCRAGGRHVHEARVGQAALQLAHGLARGAAGPR